MKRWWWYWVLFFVRMMREWCVCVWVCIFFSSLFSELIIIAKGDSVFVFDFYYVECIDFVFSPLFVFTSNNTPSHSLLFRMCAVHFFSHVIFTFFFSSSSFVYLCNGCLLLDFTLCVVVVSFSLLLLFFHSFFFSFCFISFFGRCSSFHIHLFRSINECSRTYFIGSVNEIFVLNLCAQFVFVVFSFYSRSITGVITRLETLNSLERIAQNNHMLIRFWNFRDFCFLRKKKLNFIDLYSRRRMWNEANRKQKKKKKYVFN